jgi:hypothetical protein
MDHMKNLLLLLSIILLLGIHDSTAQEQIPQNVAFVGKIQTIGGVHEIISSNDGKIMPFYHSDKQIETIVSQMLPGEEAIVKGHVIFDTKFNLEGITTHQPILIIDSIKPVSLKKLGQITKKYEIEIDHSILFPANHSYSPSAIPVTTEVASTIMLTSAFLLSQSLTGSANRPKIEDLNAGLFLISGIVATGIFIFEQIHPNKSSIND